MPFLVLGIFVAFFGAIWWTPVFFAITMVAIYLYAASSRMGPLAFLAIALSISTGASLAGYFSVGLFVPATEAASGALIFSTSGDFIGRLALDALLFCVCSAVGFVVAGGVGARVNAGWLRAVWSLLVGAATMIVFAFATGNEGGLLEVISYPSLAFDPRTYFGALTGHYPFALTWELGLMMIAAAMVRSILAALGWRGAYLSQSRR